jgi:hypothetical protein
VKEHVEAKEAKKNRNNKEDMAAKEATFVKSAICHLSSVIYHLSSPESLIFTKTCRPEVETSNQLY